MPILVNPITKFLVIGRVGGGGSGSGKGSGKVAAVAAAAVEWSLVKYNNQYEW